MEAIFVNGPVNAIRMEGIVYNIKKVIYIFMDVHVNIQYETQCTNIDSFTFIQYFLKMLNALKEENKTLDLFLEITETFILGKNIMFREIYLSEIRKYFKKKFLDKEDNTMPIIRYHYIDIRDFLKSKINDLIKILEEDINKFFTKNFQISDHQNIYTNLELFDNNLINIYDIMFGTSIKRSKREIYEDDEYNFEKIKKFINKIMKKYIHEDLSEKFNELIKIIKNNFEMMMDIIKNMIKLLDESQTFLYKSHNSLKKIDYEIMQKYNYNIDPIKKLSFACEIKKLFIKLKILSNVTFSLITDIFFLRRFLDKDYITNGIVYTGIGHSITYIYFLIKNFDFKITNIASINPDYTIADIHKIAKNIEYSRINELEKIIMPESFIQCVDLSTFPSGFI